MKKIFLCLMMFLAINNLFSQTTDEIFIQNGIRYKIINSTEVSVISNNYSGDIVIPSQVTYEDDVYNVTSIYGFYGWDGIVPDNDDGPAFQSCNELTSVIIPNSVTSIGRGAFSYCTNLSSVSIPNSVTVIPEGAFYACKALNEITIPSSVTKIESAAFGYYSDSDRSVLMSITLQSRSINIAENSFIDILISSITIPNNVDLSNAGIRIEKDGVYYKVLNNNEVSVCGTESSTKDLNIPNTVTAGNTFSVNSIEQYAFSGCTSLKSVVIPETIKKIKESAFSNCTNLTFITIPESVASIGINAFEGCTKLTKVTCMSSTPPKVNSNSFANYNSYLYVPCESKETYDLDAVWGNFKHIECIGSETVELTNDEVVVEPDKTEAVFSMPKNENANSYTLTISNNGVTFCTLTFNAQGQLANIDFSTTKSYELKSDVEGFKFTVTGLSTASDYGYSFKALASNKSVLKEYAGSFTTKNEDGTGGSSSGGGEGTLAVDAVSNATAVTVVNAQILVNGEAPAFVVTVSGQKIANANLKAGVYFVVEDGNSVKVVVR